jgi:hypothetical protein
MQTMTTNAMERVKELRAEARQAEQGLKAAHKLAREQALQKAMKLKAEDLGIKALSVSSSDVSLKMT